MNPNSTHLPYPFISALHPNNLPQKENKQTKAISPRKLQSVTQYTLLPKQLYLRMFITVSHWPGLKPLASAVTSVLYPHGTTLRYPVVTLHHGDPAALNLHNQSLHVLSPMVRI